MLLTPISISSGNNGYHIHFVLRSLSLPNVRAFLNSFLFHQLFLCQSLICSIPWLHSSFRTTWFSVNFRFSDWSKTSSCGFIWLLILFCYYFVWYINLKRIFQSKCKAKKKLMKHLSVSLIFRSSHRLTIFLVIWMARRANQNLKHHFECRMYLNFIVCEFGFSLLLLFGCLNSGSMRYWCGMNGLVAAWKGQILCMRLCVAQSESNYEPLGHIYTYFTGFKRVATLKKALTQF